MEATPSGIVKSPVKEQLLKALSPMSTSWSGKISGPVKLVLKNAKLPMLVTASGICSSPVRPEQPRNASLPMLTIWYSLPLEGLRT